MCSIWVCSQDDGLFQSRLVRGGQVADSLATSGLFDSHYVRIPIIQGIDCGSFSTSLMMYNVDEYEQDDMIVIHLPATNRGMGRLDLQRLSTNA